jgi:hypothetical protein
MGPYELPERDSGKPDDRFGESPSRGHGQKGDEGRSHEYRRDEPGYPGDPGAFDDEFGVPNIRLVDERYRGVGGWLLVLCVILTIISPLTSLFALGTGFAETAPAFAMFPGLRIIMVIDLVLSLGVVAFSIYAGIGLWTIRPGAVRTAKAYLITFLLYHGIASVLPFLAGLPPEANEAMMKEVFKSVFRALIFFGVWFSYLNVSKRVKATYENY